jgi:hypothetical protein
VVAGGLLICGNVAQLAGWANARGSLALLAALPAFAFEISFAACLLFRGLRRVPTVRMVDVSPSPAPVG